jgi:hypothetical protein
VIFSENSNYSDASLLNGDKHSNKGKACNAEKSNKNNIHTFHSVSKMGLNVKKKEIGIERNSAGWKLHDRV